MSNIIIKKDVSLDSPIMVESLPGVVFTLEGDAHEFVISCSQNGEAFPLNGNVMANFIRANETTVQMLGSIVDGDAVIVLHEDCYKVAGRFQMTIFYVPEEGESSLCIYACVSTVQASQRGMVIDTGAHISRFNAIFARNISEIESKLDDIDILFAEIEQLNDELDKLREIVESQSDRTSDIDAGVDNETQEE